LGPKKALVHAHVDVEAQENYVKVANLTRFEVSEEDVRGGWVESGLDRKKVVPKRRVHRERREEKRERVQGRPVTEGSL
jgi:hypothetical protein